jgi:hypothetical protein
MVVVDVINFVVYDKSRCVDGVLKKRQPDQSMDENANNRAVGTL